MLMSILLFVPVLRDFIIIGNVPKFPSLIVAVTLALASLQSLVCGLILDTVVRKGRQEFEYHLNI